MRRGPAAALAGTAGVSQDSLRQWRDGVKQGIDQAQRTADVAGEAGREQHGTVVVSELQGSTPQQAREQERGKGAKRPA